MKTFTIYTYHNEVILWAERIEMTENELKFYVGSELVAYFSEWDGWVQENAK